MFNNAGELEVAAGLFNNAGESEVAAGLFNNAGELEVAAGILFGGSEMRGSESVSVQPSVKDVGVRVTGKFALQDRILQINQNEITVKKTVL